MMRTRDHSQFGDAQWALNQATPCFGGTELKSGPRVRDCSMYSPMYLARNAVFCKALQSRSGECEFLRNRSLWPSGRGPALLVVLVGRDRGSGERQQALRAADWSEPLISNHRRLPISGD
jgi:hypothetical protein